MANIQKLTNGLIKFYQIDRSDRVMGGAQRYCKPAGRTISQPDLAFKRASQRN